METTEKPPSGQNAQPAGQLVRKGAGALALRSATLVARGLHDLARESNWTRKPAFVGSASKVAISGTGSVCAISAETRGTPGRVVIHELHNTFGQLALAVPGETPPLAKHLPPRSRGPGQAAIWPDHGRHGSPRFISSTWKVRNLLGHSESSSGFRRIWRGRPTHATLRRPAPAENRRRSVSGLLEPDGEHIQDVPLGQTGVPDWLERQTYEAEFGEEGAFHGYGKTAFSPDGKSLASVIEIQGDWADDSILLAEIPSLARVKSFRAQGHVSDLTWLSSGGLAGVLRFRAGLSA